MDRLLCCHERRRSWDDFSASRWRTRFRLFARLSSMRAVAPSIWGHGKSVEGVEPGHPCVHYRQELIDMDDGAFFRDSRHLFLHGIVEGKGGGCASLPVGRRLGYPLVAPCRGFFHTRLPFRETSGLILDA